MNQADSHVRALLNLIQDDDLKVASLAMEQFLKLNDGTAESLIAEHQEAADPRMRHRIHQLSGIFHRRRRRQEFIRGIQTQKMDTWQGLCHINSLYDHRFCWDTVATATAELASEMGGGRAPGLPQIAAVMRNHHFSVPEEEVIDIELYLVDSVMESRLGSSVVLTALAHHTASQAGWHGTVVLHEGRFCLIDRDHRVLDPAAEWHVSKQGTSALIHPCSPRDVWVAVLTQLFTVALVEGHLRDLHHFGSLLTTLNGNDLSSLPEPLGRG